MPVVQRLYIFSNPQGYNTISLSCYEQVCLSGLRFERTSPDDGRSISRNVAHWNILVHNVILYFCNLSFSARLCLCLFFLIWTCFWSFYRMKVFIEIDPLKAEYKLNGMRVLCRSVSLVLILCFCNSKFFYLNTCKLWSGDIVLWRLFPCKCFKCWLFRWQWLPKHR